MSEINFTPPEAARKAARTGLEQRRKYGRGGTAVGVARARDIANGKSLSPSTIRRMHSFFSRHEVDKKGKGWNPGSEGYPSNGRIAWNLWGSDAGWSFAKRVISQLESQKNRSETMSMVEKRVWEGGLRVERRSDTGEPVISGTAVVFNSLSKNLGGFHEIISPRAFDNFFETRSESGGQPDVAALWNHDVGSVLGRTPNTLQLHKDERGIHFRLTPPKSRPEIVEAIERQDVRGASFAFVVDSDSGEKWSRDEEGRSIRTVEKVSDFFEISLVLQPAYEATSLEVAKRSFSLYQRSVMDIKHRWSQAVSRIADFLESRQYPDTAHFRVGDKVFFQHEGAVVAGKVTSLMPEGVTGNELDEFNLLGIPNGPATVVQVYRLEGDNWVDTGRSMTKKYSLLTAMRDPDPQVVQKG